MSKQTEYKPTIYRPEDIEFRDGNPFLKIILGQIVLELALKNVGSEEEPVWIAWFDPRQEEVKNAGANALVEMLGDIDLGSLALTPSSSKSGPMIEQACLEVGLPLLTLQGGKDKAQLEKQMQGGKIYDYHPITSPDKAKYMAFSQETSAYIIKIVRAGEKIIILDDVYSTGNTIKTILLGLKDILGMALYEQAQIEVITVAREGVIYNGDHVSPINMEQGLTYSVFIPEVIGDLNTAINK